MKILIIFLLLFTLSCSTNKVSQNHGFRSLETIYKKIAINKTNKNDVKTKIGPPSSISEFNKNKWFYIERKKTNQSLLKLGVKKINVNNVLVLEFSDLGILKKKDLLNLSDMNEIKISKNITDKKFKQDNMIYDIFSSFREKINAPARRTRRKNN